MENYLNNKEFSKLYELAAQNSGNENHLGWFFINEDSDYESGITSVLMEYQTQKYSSELRFVFHPERNEYLTFRDNKLTEYDISMKNEINYLVNQFLKNESNLKEAC